eukprot:CAMPEP_0114541316 /NCGR_PEP_ID=MMETSP0114-20121206/1240_1 /TAXON_ID=31324 /ORGANISM="Goniomonas sp, Strain m" /LENGTH=72 /DNA_ID=CAMNT_0001725545 /DNA_START=798 /DNA_END=1013 /DNA_ORIENTATION=-
MKKETFSVCVLSIMSVADKAMSNVTIIRTMHDATTSRYMNHRKRNGTGQTLSRTRRTCTSKYSAKVAKTTNK